MPVVRVTLIEGYDEATRVRLGERLTDAVRSVIDAPLDGVTVAIGEVKAGNYMRGRQAKRPGEPLPDPVDLVKRSSPPWKRAISTKHGNFSRTDFA